tara:strand:+ start:972496 stop:972747 length:252 start_codon:yes stop_codon:yes gene_type:complete
MFVGALVAMTLSRLAPRAAKRLSQWGSRPSLSRLHGFSLALFGTATVFALIERDVFHLCVSLVMTSVAAAAFIKTRRRHRAEG